MGERIEGWAEAVTLDASINEEIIKMSSDGKQHKVHLKRNSGHCSSIAKPTGKKENNKKLILGAEQVCLWFCR